MAKKSLPIDKFLDIENLSLQERISERRNAQFQPGCSKFSTKNEMGELANCWRGHQNQENEIDYSKLGGDGIAMIFGIDAVI